MSTSRGRPGAASVVIPVKDGERYLAELLEALAREGVEEVLVIDSGSRDHSREVARAAGAELLEIEPREFGHGRTRNLGAARTSGELICFLTQDATPTPGWLAAYRAAFALDERAGAAYGPHLARPETSPMIARELESFFASFSPDGKPGRAARRRPHVSLERQRLLPARLLGGGALPRARLLRGPSLWGGHARRRLEQGLPAGRGGSARARLRSDRVHAPLLRRVPRAARDQRTRRAVRARGPAGVRRARDDRRPPLARRARRGTAAASPLDGPGERPPHRPTRLLGARVACRADPGAAARPPIAREARRRRERERRGERQRSRRRTFPGGRRGRRPGGPRGRHRGWQRRAAGCARPDPTDGARLGPEAPRGLRRGRARLARGTRAAARSRARVCPSATACGSRW